MIGTEQKSYPPDQMNIRLGSKYIQEFNNYMEKHGGKKIDFIREALSFWMSVDGKPDDILRRLQAAEDTASIAKERLEETKTYCEQRINDLNRIIEEKDARLDMLSHQISSLSIIHQQTNSNIPENPQPQKSAWTKEIKNQSQ